MNTTLCRRDCAHYRRRGLARRPSTWKHAGDSGRLDVRRVRRTRQRRRSWPPRRDIPVCQHLLRATKKWRTLLANRQAGWVLAAPEAAVVPGYPRDGATRDDLGRARSSAPHRLPPVDAAAPAISSRRRQSRCKTAVPACQHRIAVMARREPARHGVTRRPRLPARDARSLPPANRCGDR